MNKDVWKYVWNEFCETQTHLDKLLSKIPETYGGKIKEQVATRLGPFLRRPWSVAQALGIQLAETPEAFWNQSYINLKKNEAIHKTLFLLSNTQERLPTEGTVADFPTTLTEPWTSDWGSAHVARLCALLSQDPLTVIRVRRNFLEQAKIAFPKSRAGRFSPHARIFRGYEPVLGTEIYQQGGLEIQDEGSQLMSLFALYPEVFAGALTADPQIAKKVFEAVQVPKAPKSAVWIDACAGAGGKTLALADFLQGQSRIFAYDIYERKIQRLKKRVGHAQETNVQAFALTEELLKSTQERFKESADGVLLDSPCSGHGVLRRNPDLKWNRKPLPKAQEKTLTIDDLQKQVLRDYSTLVKPGGRLVYGVCTFNKSETVGQVNWFLDYAKENGMQFKLAQSGFIGPYETDGFFMALLERDFLR